jgi:adenylylsulfate kinase
MGVIWITGRPASGKSTLARSLADEFSSRGIRASVVDSDEVRAAITPEPRYTSEERALVYRAAAYLASRLAQEGIVAVVSATSHAAEYRRWAREICPGLFLIYARCPLKVCEARDPKGLYRRARTDERTMLPGVGVSYEEPVDADRIVDTELPMTQTQIRGLVDAFLAPRPASADAGQLLTTEHVDDPGGAEAGAQSDEAGTVRGDLADDRGGSSERVAAEDLEGVGCR